jgi:monolysocardiolipin acyltransferase
MFGEGKVTQQHQYQEVDGRARLIRFKWGMYVCPVLFLLFLLLSSFSRGRIIMETERPPIVIPMWITGT